MTLQALEGARYVRLAPGAAEKVAPYLGVAADDIDELLLALDIWPDAISPRPRRARDGRLIEGDPIVLGACSEGLLFSASSTPCGLPEGRTVLVPWERVAALHVLGPVHP